MFGLTYSTVAPERILSQFNPLVGSDNNDFRQNEVDHSNNFLRYFAHGHYHKVKAISITPPPLTQKKKKKRNK